MIDKLVLKSVVTNRKYQLEEMCKRLFDQAVVIRLRDRHYENALQIKITTEQLAFVIKDKPFFGNPHLRIEINPSHLTSATSLFYITEKFLNHSFLIHRIDFNVDLNIELQDVFKSLMIPRKRLRVEYHNMCKLKLLNYGQRPEVVCCYEKDNVTRVEVRFFGNKVPIKDFSQLIKYVEINPFERLSFIKIKSPTSKLKDVATSKALNEQLVLQGAMATRRAINQTNKNNNFKRDYDKFFVQNENFPNLYQIHQKELSAFFKNDEEKTNE